MNPELITLVDFHYNFFPAAKLLLSRQSPYINKGFFNPPWVLYPILPLTILPEWLASLVWVIVNIVIIFYALNLAADYLGVPKSRKRALLVAALTISPFPFAVAFTGQLSSFVLLGLVVSFARSFNWAAPAFLLIKPQIGLVPTLIWLARRILFKDWWKILFATFLLIILLLPALLMASDTLNSFIANLLSGYYYSISPEYIIAPYRVLIGVGLPGWLSLVITGVALWALYKKPTLPMVATATLLIAPYIRTQDNILLLVPTLLFIKERRHLWMVFLLISLPLFRLLIPALNQFWIDELAPIGMFALLIWEYDLLRPLAVRARSLAR